MYLSVLSDELFLDAQQSLPIISSWGVKYVDFRGMINGKPIEKQSPEELKSLKKLMDDLELKAGVIQSSLCKINLPSEERQKEQMEKLDGIIRASEILGTRLVRSFNYWQHRDNDPAFGQLAVRPDVFQQVLEMFYPIAKRAKEAGLILGFENCGQTVDEVIALLKGLGIKEWGIAWDPSNYWSTNEEVKKNEADFIIKCLNYTNMMHVKAISILPELKDVILPWDRILAGVSATGKDIPVTIETHNPKGSPFTHEEATERTVKAIRGVWPSAAPGDLKAAVTAKPVISRPYADDPVRFVVVGMGMGKLRSRQITKTPGCMLYGVVDTNEEKAKAAGEEFNVPYSTDVNVFLNDPKVEVMYVVTPTGLHGEVAEQCLKAGKHVLTTKPFDANVEACDRMIRLAEEKGLLLGCDFDLRCDPATLEIVEAARSGYFGNILSATLQLKIKRTQEYYNENGGWRGTWKYDGGGAMSNQGIHEIDRLIYILGVPKRVCAHIYTQNHEIEAEDLGIGLWEYDNGCVVHFYSTTNYPLPAWYVNMEIHGTKGALMMVSGRGGEPLYKWWNAADKKWLDNPPVNKERIWSQGSDNFASAVRLGTPLVGDGKVARLSRLVLDCMYDSARNDGKWVEVPAGE